MKQRFLITTALPETWVKDRPVLFLGEWCRLHSQKDTWSKMDAEVLAYHWDDRQKLHADFKITQELYEKLLRELSEQLNKIHGETHSLRYWRILIGPWLNTFIETVFDRWECLHRAAQEYDLSETIILKNRLQDNVPLAMVDFLPQSVADHWNHFIYSEILRYNSIVKYQEIPTSHLATKKSPHIGFAKLSKEMLVKSLSKIMQLFKAETDAFFITTYLERWDEVKLHLRFKQAPQYWRLPPFFDAQLVKRVHFDMSKRLWALSSAVPSDKTFENFVRVMIPHQIPMAYLEGYASTCEQVAKLPWPKNPKLIWSSNHFVPSILFQAWVATRVERGSPLFIGQHGGNYGTSLFSTLEDHEMAISDYYLSWGWQDATKPKIKPVGQLKSKKPEKKHSTKPSQAILVTNTCPRYSQRFYSVMLSRQWLDYFEDQCLFIDTLPEKIQQSFIVRLYRGDYGWQQENRWREKFPHITLDLGQAPINQHHQLNKMKLYVSTYNATTFLESFTMGIPTVMYWNPNHWELRPDAMPYFEELKRVGIFYDDPKLAAQHVAKIWDDVESWWLSADVQTVVQNFCHQYSRLPDNLLDTIETTLKSCVAEHSLTNKSSSGV